MKAHLMKVVPKAVLKVVQNLNQKIKRVKANKAPKVEGRDLRVALRPQPE